MEGDIPNPEISGSKNSQILRPSTFRLIVFDLDGTLVDSLRDLAESANALLVSCGAAPLDEHAIGRMVGDGAATLVARAFAAAGVPAPADALARFLAIYETRLLNHTRPYDGVPSVLAELDRGSALAVLTNKPIASTRKILAGLELERFFDADAVIGGDGPFPRKPDPAGLRALAERAAVPVAETILVGDSAVDWQTANRAGAQICLVRYGFGFNSVPASALNSGAVVIDRPSEIFSVVRI